MNPNLFSHNTFTKEAIATFKPMMKIGLLATITPEGHPHLTMLSTLMAADEKTMTWGQFTEGTSFHNVRENPKVGWLIMTMDKDLWRGQGIFTHTKKSGSEFDFYNNVPMFRYNAYFGIHTAYYMDMEAHTGKQSLPMGAVVLSAIKTIFSKLLFRKGKTAVLNEWSQSLYNKLDNLKFLAYVTETGYPVIIPVIQTQSAGSQHLIFSTGVYTDELKDIPKGISMALFGLSLDMTDVVVRGTYHGLRRVGPHRCGVLAVDWVYNPMPPIPQQIYPPLPLEAVEIFDTQ